MRRIVLLVTLLLGAASARAAPPEDAAERDSRARTDFAAGRYQEALDAYARLYAETLHPTYLRNVGRCHQNLGNASKAITSFREYLRNASNVTPRDRAQIEGYIREMEGLEKRQQLEQRQQAATAPAPSLATSVPPGEPTPPPGRSLRASALAMGIVTAGATAFGVVMSLRVQSLTEEVTQDLAKGQFDPARAEAGRSAERLQWLGYGVAGAGLIATGVLYYLGQADPPPARGARVAPWLEGGVAGVGVGGRF